ncbi:hypothetical protein GIS00_24710 [Nakamurella sp. YIM 132087]|uniref:Uncharacterized protein n=1 Tax=Nakamurella alba TaxID=2665158 RepID=A0A7K1FST7_9ACTN|nr:hypothetical protein [Nakamurella alba]MTD17140.1 hypothetical protein [Nakamurella alba]
MIAIIIVIVAAAIAAGAKTLIQGTLSGLSYGKTLASLASLFIIFLGVVAALNQIGVATTVTTPILITILAIIAGVVIVGAGGGLIKPMQERWEKILMKVEEEVPTIKQQAQAAPSAKEIAAQKAAEVKQAYEQADRKPGASPTR